MCDYVSVCIVCMHSNNSESFITGFPTNFGATLPLKCCKFLNFTHSFAVFLIYLHNLIIFELHFCISIFFQLCFRSDFHLFTIMHFPLTDFHMQLFSLRIVFRCDSHFRALSNKDFIAFLEGKEEIKVCFSE